MRYTVYEAGEIIGDVYLDDDATEQQVIDALDAEDLLPDDDDDFDVASEAAPDDADFPLAFFVTADDNPVCELWPDGYEPEPDDELLEEDEKAEVGHIIDAEYREVN